MASLKPELVPMDEADAVYHVHPAGRGPSLAVPAAAAAGVRGSRAAVPPPDVPVLVWPACWLPDPWPCPRRARSTAATAPSPITPPPGLRTGRGVSRSRRSGPVTAGAGRTCDGIGGT